MLCEGFSAGKKNKQQPRDSISSSVSFLGGSYIVCLESNISLPNKLPLAHPLWLAHPCVRTYSLLTPILWFYPDKIGYGITYLLLLLLH